MNNQTYGGYNIFICHFFALNNKILAPEVFLNSELKNISSTKILLLDASK